MDSKSQNRKFNFFSDKKKPVSDEWQSEMNKKIVPKPLVYIRPGPVTTKDYVELISHLESILGEDYKFDLLPRTEGGLILRRDPIVPDTYIRIVRMNVGSAVTYFTPDEKYDSMEDMFAGMSFPLISNEHYATLNEWKAQISKDLEKQSTDTKFNSQVYGLGNVIFYDRDNIQSITTVDLSFEIEPNYSKLEHEYVKQESNVWLKGEILAFRKSLEALYFREDNDKERPIVEMGARFAKDMQKKKETANAMKEFITKQQTESRSTKPTNLGKNSTSKMEEEQESKKVRNQPVVLTASKKNVPTKSCHYPFCPQNHRIIQDVPKRCSRCKAVYYCGVPCQKSDWPCHLEVCLSLSKLAEDS